MDSISAFLNYGFFTKERKAYSFPLKITAEKRKDIAILGNTGKSNAENKEVNGSIIIDSLLLYEENQPLSAFISLQNLLTEMRARDIKKILQGIISFNINATEKLLRSKKTPHQSINTF